jgi:putative transposase
MPPITNGVRNMGGCKWTKPDVLKELEKENNRLKKAVANLTVDKLILQEVVQGK